MDSHQHLEALASLSKKKEARPFVLTWAEKTKADKLKASELYFSESISGLTMENNRESFETTGAPGTEGADTTF